jgi:hypothetical protein
MRGISVACAVAALGLSGCSVHYSARVGSPGEASVAQASVASGTPLGNAIIIGIMLADGMRYFRLGESGGAPGDDPRRAINVQDCTRPVDPGAGNLFCR